MAYHVGQKLWMVPRKGTQFDGSGRVVTVTKIGRVWATLDHPSYRPYRFDLKTGKVDGGGYSSPAAIYLSKEDCENTLRRQQTWDALRQRIGNAYHIPANLTVERMQEIAAELGIV